ncbi:Multiple PDZ domain protein [Ditylenchus destructor]|nr:Multiple PDZ domain protein [Ditylenchus destructor]
MREEDKKRKKTKKATQSVDEPAGTSAGGVEGKHDIKDANCRGREPSKSATKDSHNPTVEREPAAKPAKSPMKEPPSVAKAPIFDLCLPDDVLAIMAANKNFFKSPHKNPSILKKTSRDSRSASRSKSSKSHRSSVSPAKPEEQSIEFEPSGRPLRATPKRIGS